MRLSSHRRGRDKSSPKSPRYPERVAPVRGARKAKGKSRVIQRRVIPTQRPEIPPSGLHMTSDDVHASVARQRAPSRSDGRDQRGRYTAESWCRYNRGRGGRARAQAHSAEWRRRSAQYAARVRWNRVRAQRGLPLLPLPDFPRSQKPRAVLMRAREDMARRRAAYEGVPYHKRMASDPAVRRALEG